MRSSQREPSLAGSGPQQQLVKEPGKASPSPYRLPGGFLPRPKPGVAESGEDGRDPPYLPARTLA